MKTINLHHKIRVWVPQGAQHMLEQLKLDACTLVGGFTLTHGVGGWVDDAQNIITEEVAILEAFAADPKLGVMLYDRWLGTMQRTAEQVILLEYNGVAFAVRREMEEIQTRNMGA